MLVPGSSVVSPSIRLPRADYEAAWFFEENEDRNFKWVAYQGTGPESCVTSDGGLDGSMAIRLIFTNSVPFFCKMTLVFVK